MQRMDITVDVNHFYGCLIGFANLLNYNFVFGFQIKLEP